MPTTIKLQQPATDYFRFQDNQVLTASQLNRLIDYFETQHRLSRTCLVGVGNVCGLEVQADIAGDVIEISSGCGITTDGDLIHVPEKLIFKEFAVFEDKKAHYPAFWETDNSALRYQLWQLLDGSQDEDIPTFKIKEIGSKITDKTEDIVVLAYLDNYPKDQGPCTPLDCNNQGEKQVADLKFLLLERVAVDDIIRNFDSIYDKHNSLLSAYFTLPRLRTPKVVINAKSASNYNTLINAYNSSKIRTYRRAALQAFLDLGTGFNAVLDTEGEIDLKDWQDHFDKYFPSVLSRGTYPLAFQYRYGHFEDLVQAYSEIREELYEVLVECLPAVRAFPHHLMLGRLTSSVVDPDYRHQFYPSPVNTNNDRRLLEVQSMYRRLDMLINSYIDPIDFLKRTEEELFLKITPSLKLTRSLSDKAIPYYYNFSEGLLKSWDFKKTQRGQEKENLSYHAHQYASRSDQPILSPIDFEHEDKDFYRIEGHLGKAYGDVMEQLKVAQAEKGLNFDVIALRIGGENTSFDLADYRHYFQDLEALLDAWKAEQKCLAQNVTRFFSAFSLKDPGENLLYANMKASTATLKEKSLFRRAGPGALSGLKIGTGSTSSGMFRGDITTGAIFDIPYSTGEITGKVADVLLSGEAAAREATSAGELYTLSKTYSTAKEGNSIFVENTGVYLQDTTVKDNVVSEDDAIGSKMIEVLQTNLDDASYEFRERTYNGIYEYLDKSGLEVADDVFVLTYEVPVNIVAFLNTLISKLPDDLDQLNTNSIAAFKKAMQNLIKNVQIAKQNVIPRFSKEEYKEKEYREDYLLLLNQIEINACAAKKIEVLMDEYLRRKEEILKLTSFAHYAGEHPGLEHKGGVPRGGTFVVVYKEDKKESSSSGLSLGTNLTQLQRPKLSLLENLSKSLLPTVYRIDTTALEKRAQDISLKKGLSIKNAETKAKREELTKKPDEFARFVINNHNLVNVEQSVQDYQLVTGVSTSLTNLIKGAVYEGITLTSKEGIEPDVSNFTVIADFCLPYRCCSELPPMVFVLPKEKVDLRLPVASLCIKKDLSDKGDIGLLPLQVVPVDGVVSLDVEHDGLLEVNENDQYFFNPAAIDENLLNTTIRFKVNDQETSASLKIYRRPEPLFDHVIKGPIERFNSISYILNLTNKTVEETGENLAYFWDFGDGNTSTDKNPKHTYTFFPRELTASKKMTVRLQVANVACRETLETEIILPVIDEGQFDPACVKNAMKVIKADQERLSEFVDDEIKISRRDDIQFWARSLMSIYKKLEDEEVQKAYFSGRNNQELFNGISQMLSKIQYVLITRPKEDEKQLAPLLGILLLRLFMTLIQCQERLTYGEEIKELIGEVTRALSQINRNFKPFLKEELPALEAFLKNFEKENKIKDLRLLSALKAVFDKIGNK